jgi:hypothetical protein
MLSLKPYIFIVIGILLPTCVVLSPLFPFLIKESAIFLWMIAFPLAVFCIKDRSRLLFMLVAVWILVVQSYGVAWEHPQKLLYILISLMTMLYVSFSRCRLDSDEIHKMSVGLGFGAFFINVITLVAMYQISLGVIDISDLAEIFGFPDEYGLFRFSLGNAIHVPFLMSICTIMGTRYLRSQWLIFLFLSLNLITASIAQSRGVLLISLVHLFFLYPKMNSFFKIFIPSVCVFAFVYFFEEISIVTDSLMARFSGDDYGSADTRTLMLNLVLEAFDGRIAIFGGGLLSSQELFFAATGRFDSVEAALVEISYELGILTAAMFLLPLFFRMMRVGLVKNIPIYFYLILGQTFFLVPVSTMFGLTFTLVVLLLDCYRNDQSLSVPSAGTLQKT